MCLGGKEEFFVKLVFFRSLFAICMRRKLPSQQQSKNGPSIEATKRLLGLVKALIKSYTHIDMYNWSNFLE